MREYWLGFASLICGLTALLVFFTSEQWEVVVAALGDTAGEILSIAMTWSLVLLPILGFSLGLAGLARERRKTLPAVALLVNGLGLAVTGLVLYVLTG